jgi:hypothetical protein
MNKRLGFSFSFFLHYLFTNLSLGSNSSMRRRDLPTRISYRGWCQDGEPFSGQSRIRDERAFSEMTARDCSAAISPGGPAAVPLRELRVRRRPAPGRTPAACRLLASDCTVIRRLRYEIIRECRVGRRLQQDDVCKLDLINVHASDY